MRSDGPVAPSTAEAPRPTASSERRDATASRTAIVSAAPPEPQQRAAAARYGDDEDDDDLGLPRRRRNPRTTLIAIASIAAALGIAALVAFGYLNSDRYVLACEPELAVPEQGRRFPPWGTHALSGEAWRPLPIAAATRCQSQETDDPLVLERSFLAMLLDQATGILVGHELTHIDDAERLLQQALLLTRPSEHESALLAKQRSDQHAEIERLLGDVTYWRAAAKIRDASAALGDAARQFDAAVAQHPRHATDAAAWASYARKLAQDLRTGPSGTAPGAPPAAAPRAPSPAAPPAAAGASSASAAVAPITAKPSEAAPPAAPPATGVPSGGVLL